MWYQKKVDELLLERERSPLLLGHVHEEMAQLSLRCAALSEKLASRDGWMSYGGFEHARASGFPEGPSYEESLGQGEGYKVTSA